MRLSATLGIMQAPAALGLGQGDAESLYQAFNNVFLVRSGNAVFYKSAINNANRDGTWSASLDILGAQDAYERTGDPEKKTLINELLTTWLDYTPTPWSWDGWNDDIGWFSLALIRGYQITSNPRFLDAAKYGFDYAFGRGWDTQHNGGGIWEENPEYAARENPPKTATKEALANDSLGKVACMIYQSTHDGGYLQKAQQIYTWVSANLFNHTTGQINTGIAPDGHVDTGSAAYNQGTFLDYAHLLYLTTGDPIYRTDAHLALDYGLHNLTNANGIFNNTQNYLNTWADEFARGAGHFIRDNGLWATYHTAMKANADAIVRNRRSDLCITWNGWDEPTPHDDDTLSTNKFVSAVAWLQFTPTSIPDEVGGIHTLTNSATNTSLDSGGKIENGSPLIQWGKNASLNQRWLLTANDADESWNIINLASWKALDCPGGRGEEGMAMVQWTGSRDGNQRWGVERLEDGSYKIWNRASGKVLDGGSGGENGAPVVQEVWNGSAQQRWMLE